MITISEILSQTIEIYKRNFRRLVPVLFLLLVPGVILTIFGLLFNTSARGVPSLVNTILTISISLITTLFGLWTSIVLIRVLAQIIHKKQVPLPQNLWSAVSQMPQSIWVILLGGGIILLGVLALVIPGIIFSLWFVFGLFVVVLEDLPAWQALQRSKSLSRGRWWNVLWRLLVPILFWNLIYILINGLYIFILNVIMQTPVQGPSILTTILTGAFGNILAVVLSPATTLGMLLLYFNLTEQPVQDNQPKAHVHA